MRDVLFRGKRIDNGEWVHGNLIQRNLWGAVFPIIRVEDNGFDNYKEWEVIPETVGQYTGLDDKNGVKIFEGDILRGSRVNLIVAYEGAGFIAYYWMDHDYGYGTEKMWCNLVEGGEVIGNIHDNTEVTE